MIFGSMTFLTFGTIVPRSVEASIYAVGRVISVERDGDVRVRRRGGGHKVIEEGMLLFGGDVFEFDATGRILASIYGDRITYTHDKPQKEIPFRSIGPIERADEEYFDQFSEFIAEPPPLMKDYSDHRDQNKHKFALSKSVLAPVGRQLFLAEIPKLALVWEGGLARLSIKPASGNSQVVDSGVYEWCVVDRPKDVDQFKIEIHENLSWSFDVVGIGTVEKMSGRKLKSEYASRLRWAHETLLAPASQFKDLRVLALSILADLAQPNLKLNNEFARAAWLAAQNRRMSAQVGTVGSR